MQQNIGLPALERLRALSTFGIRNRVSFDGHFCTSQQLLLALSFLLLLLPPIDCLLLENLTRRFRSPCILDVKLGQQYGEDADEKKRAQHLIKVANSTCQTLGVRIYGMQVGKNFLDSSLIIYFPFLINTRNLFF